MTDLKGQVNRMELAMDRRFDRIDARMEQLFGLITGREGGTP